MDAFKLDPNIILPKQGKNNTKLSDKTDYNISKYNIKKHGNNVVNTLVLKPELENVLSKSQYAYRKQKSCKPKMVKICNSISEAN